MQTEDNAKVELDINKRKYVITTKDWFKQRMGNNKAKQVAKVDVPVVKVIKEIKEFGGDNKGATDCNFPVSQRHFPVHQISKDYVSEFKLVATDTLAQESNDSSDRD